jgi:hypothetical protein
MSKSFLDVFERHGEAGRPGNYEEVSRGMDATCTTLANLLAVCRPPVRQDLLAQFLSQTLTILGAMDGAAQEALAGAGTPSPRPELPTPEVVEWARQQYTEEDIVAGLREVRETGGRELRDFLGELEQTAGTND